MKNILKYKNYTGEIEFNTEDKLFHGRILGIKDIISFEGKSIEELEKDIEDAVEDYLEVCEEINKKPEKPFSGKFVLRMSSELHSKIALTAKQQNKSLNNMVTDILERNFTSFSY